MSNKLIVTLLLFWIAETNVAFSDDLSLPSDKTTIVNCQDVVLAEHGGRIVREKLIHFSGGNFEIHLEVNDKDSVGWMVICDGKTGKILKDFKLDEEK